MPGANEEYIIDVMIGVTDHATSQFQNTENQLAQLEQRASKVGTTYASAYLKAMDQWDKRMAQWLKHPYLMRLEAIDKASAAIGRIGDRAMSLVRRPYEVVIRAKDLATAPIRGAMNLLTSYQTYMMGLLATGAGAAAVAWPIKLADNLTQANISFQTMLGSAAKANAFMKQVQDFAAATPFSTQQTVSNAQYLLSQGWSQSQVIPILQAVGDAISAAGGNLNDIRNVLMALSQMRANGRVDAQDMDQLINANLPAWQILAQSMHKTVAEVRQLSQNGKIDSGPAVQAIISGLEQRYGGAMNLNANKTVSGVLSQIWSAVSTNVATPWGQGLQQGLIPYLSKLNDWLSRNKTLLDQWGSTLRHWGQEGADWVAQKVQNLVSKLRTLTESQAWMNAPTLWDKLKVGWDDIVVAPFDRWWAGPGQQAVRNIAGDIGGFFGKALHTVIAEALGLVTPSTSTHTVTVDLTPGKRPDILRHLTPDDQQAFMKSYVKNIPTNVFADAGQTAGTAFFNAFAKAFDAKQLADKAVAALGAVQPWNAQSWGQWGVGTALDLLLVGWGLKTLTAPVRWGAGTLRDFQDAKSMLGRIFGRGTPVATETAIREAGEATNSIAGLSKVTNALRPVARMAGPATAVIGAYDFLRAPTAQAKGAAAGSALGGLTGAEAGAVIGAMAGSVIPGIGTAVGGVIGGLLGAFGGSHLGSWFGGKVGSLFDHHPTPQTAGVSPTFSTKPSWTGTVPVQQTNNQQQTITVFPGTYNFNIQVDGGDPQQILSVIQEHGATIASNLADNVAEEIGKRLERTHANMPVGRVYAY